MTKHVVYISTDNTKLFSAHKYENFKSFNNGSYFEQKEFDNKDFMHKSFINSINYEPDLTFYFTYGFFGTCWSARIFDSAETNITYYHFRNFEHLVNLYNEKGYNFIEKI